MTNIAREITETVKLTGEAVDNEMFCLELATILCSPAHCGTMDVAKCITAPNKFIVIKRLNSGNKLHICVDNGSVEVRVLDKEDNLLKSIVPECQTVLRNAITVYIQQIRELKAREEKAAMELVSAELQAEVKAISAGDGPLPFCPGNPGPDASTREGKEACDALRGAIIAAISCGAAEAMGKACKKAKAKAKAKKPSKSKASKKKAK